MDRATAASPPHVLVPPSRQRRKHRRHQLHSSPCGSSSAFYSCVISNISCHRAHGQFWHRQRSCALWLSFAAWHGGVTRSGRLCQKRPTSKPCRIVKWGFPKIKGIILGGPYNIRIIVFWGIGVPLFRETIKWHFMTQWLRKHIMSSS